MIIRARLPLALATLLSVATGCEDTDTTADGGALTDGGLTAGDAAANPSAPGACGVAESEPNEDRAAATPYVAGTNLVACVGKENDVDFYEVTSPAEDIAGGFYQGSFTDVGEGTLEVNVYTASDNSIILQNTYTVDKGASLHLYWAAAPANKYRLAVKRFGGFEKAFKYTMKLAYTKVNDIFEPNDKREQAKPLTLATPVMGYLFAGHSTKDLKAVDYLDWFSVPLAAGKVTVKLDNVPENIAPELKLFDSTGKEIKHGYSTTMGGSVMIMDEAVAAGTHFVHVGIFGGVPDAANKTEPMKTPASFTRPYTSTVTQ